MKRKIFTRLAAKSIFLVSFLGLFLTAKLGLALTLSPLPQGEQYNILPVLPGLEQRNYFFMPLDNYGCKSCFVQTQAQENINWTDWIVKEPAEMLDFVKFLLVSGETEEQRQAVSDKINELVPDLKDILNKSSSLKFRMGSTEKGDFLWEYSFLDAQGKEIASFVFRNSPVTPPEGVLKAWKRTETKVKINDPETGKEAADLVISLVEDGSGDLVLKETVKNKKFLIKKDGTVTEEPGEPTNELDELINKLKDDKLPVEERIEAAKKLGEIGGEKAFKALIEIWRQYHELILMPSSTQPEDPYKKELDLLKLGRAITEVLISMGEQVIQPLTDLFKDPEAWYGTRIEILEVFSKIGSEKAIPLFKYAITTDLYDGLQADWFIKGAAVDYLVKMNAQVAQEFFTDILTHPDNYTDLTRQFSINGLAKIGDKKEIVDTLIHTLENDPDEFIRSWAARRLADLGKVEAVELIIRQLVGSVGAPNFISALEKLLDKITDPALKELASALVSLSHNSRDRDKLPSDLARLVELGDLRALPALSRLLANFKEEKGYEELFAKVKDSIIQIAKLDLDKGLEELNRILASLIEKDPLRPILKALIDELGGKPELPAKPASAPAVGVHTEDKVELSWEPIERAETYDLRILDKDGNEVKIITGLNSTSLVMRAAELGMVADRQYQVQVRGVNESGMGEFSPLSALFKIEPVDTGPITPDKIYKEFGVRVVNGDIVGINLMYRALKENYGVDPKPGFDPHSIIYAGAIPQEDLDAVYRILKSLPKQLIDGLKEKTIKLYSGVLEGTGMDIAGATFVEEPQLEKGHVYIFYSKALEQGGRFRETFESILTHELMHVVYKTGLTETDIQKLRENFWHGESDIQKVLSNIYDFADPRMSYYRNKPNVEEIIMEDWAYAATSYFENSINLIAMVKDRTDRGLSSPITLPTGERSSVIKEKLKFIANLFRHTVNGLDMTYIYKIENGIVFRAEVGFRTDGLPDVVNAIWQRIQ